MIAVRQIAVSALRTAELPSTAKHSSQSTLIGRLLIAGERGDHELDRLFES